MQRTRLVLVGIVALTTWQVWAGALKLAPLFQDHMVLQRDARVPVWGWAAPGATVRVTIAGQTATTTANPDGAWQVKVGPFEAGTALTFTAASDNETLSITNALAGDVWLCSGQSNMQFGLGRSSNGTAEVAAANFPAIRVFSVANTTAADPQRTVVGAWQVCTPQTANRFTAVGYFFGRELNRDLKVPIGLIQSSWGGTRAEAWISREALSALPAYTNEVAQAAGEGPNRVNTLYNGMIAPLLPYRLRGAIWYQGEGNADRAAQYRGLLAVLIADWRARFDSGAFPFGIVQLANFKAAQTDPGENSGWANLREAQTLVAQTVTNCGLATIIDIGDADDIHPRNKQDVGRRLALWALHDVYGRNVEFSGPVFTRCEVRGHEATLHFDHARGLMARGGQPTGFVIASADKKYVWAQARIVGDTVVVSAPEVALPVVVRYGWANNPPANLYNGAGLPAVPFHTDRP